MDAGTVFVYGRPGIGSSSTGSGGTGGAPDTGHVFVTIQDNRTGKRVDVDIWNGPKGQMAVNDHVDNARREAHDVVSFDVNRQALDRMIAAADSFHLQSLPYSVVNMNCTDAVEFVLSKGLSNVPDFTLPASLFDAMVKAGEQGLLPNFQSHFCDSKEEYSRDGTSSNDANLQSLPGDIDSTHASNFGFVGNGDLGLAALTAGEFSSPDLVNIVLDNDTFAQFEFADSLPSVFIDPQMDTSLGVVADMTGDSMVVDSAGSDFGGAISDLGVDGGIAGDLGTFADLGSLGDIGGDVASNVGSDFGIDTSGIGNDFGDAGGGFAPSDSGFA